METVTTREVPVSETSVYESTAHPRVSWGAIFSGAVVSLAVWAMLYALGLAVGLSALDPGDPSTLKSSGIFTGIWGMVAPLLALFVGGVVAARSSGVARRLDGAIHGLVMWGLSTVIGAWMVGMFMATLVGGAASLGRTSVETRLRQGATPTEQFQGPMDRARGALEELGSGAAPRPESIAAAEESGKAFGGMFGALFLGMVSAVFGAIVGLRTRHDRGRVVTTTPRTEPLTTQREVYP